MDYDYNLDGYADGVSLSTIPPWTGSTTVAVLGIDGYLDNNGSGSVRHSVATNDMEVSWIGATNLTHTLCALAVRITDHYNHIGVYWTNATTLRLYKLVSTANTPLGDYVISGSRSVGDSLRLRVTASGAVTVYYNGAAVLTAQVSDHATVKKVGITSLSARGSNIATSIHIAETFQEITSVAAGTDTVAIGGTYSCSVVEFGSPVISGTLDGVPLTLASDTSITIPNLIDGAVTPRLGKRTLTLTNGVLTATRTVTVTEPSGLASVRLGSNFSTGIDTILYGLVPAAVEFDWIFNDPTKSTVDKYGGYSTNIDGSQTLWHLENSTGIARSYQAITDLDDDGGVVVVTGGLTSSGLTSSGLTRVGLTSSGL